MKSIVIAVVLIAVVILSVVYFKKAKNTDKKNVHSCCCGCDSCCSKESE